MPTDAALLAQLQTLWQAMPQTVKPLGTTTDEAKAGLEAEPAAGDLDRLPDNQAAADLDPFDWFELIDDAEREYLLGRHRYPERCGFCGGHYRHNPRCVALCDEWAVKMPFGKHKGQRVANVPADYLRWLLANGSEIESELRGEIERVLGTSR